MKRIFPIITANIPEFRAFNEKRTRYDAEKEKQENEIKELKTQLTEIEAEPQNRNRDQNITRLRSQIETKERSLQTYILTNSVSLGREEEQLKRNQTLIARLNNAIQAEANYQGISVVLDRSQPGVVWVDLRPTARVDITDLVIARLRGTR
jgi:Skp family chaperone for outer membrane proteins